jgi:HlyD family secretion protein/epimerase transport system membrane fusion protein
MRDLVLSPSEHRSPIIDAVAEPPRLSDLVRRQARGGMILTYMFVVGGLVWASTAPLAEGAVASGIVSPDGSRRTVQHLEGGIIDEIKVRDGDRVEAGAPLVVLQSKQATALYDLLLEQMRTLEATRARLLAEQAGADEVSFPADLAGSAEARVRDIVTGQRELFEQRRTALQSELDVLDTRIKQLEEQKVALEAQVRSAQQQVGLIREELDAKQKLVAKALLAKSEALQLQRAEAALLGEKGSYLGRIAEVDEKIGELGTQRVSVLATRAAEVATDLEEARANYIDVVERLNASRDVLDRTLIYAPVTGKIANLHFKSVGGVIRPGEPILDIVPTDEQLLIDAKISPADIDVVSPGLPATIHLTAYSSRGLPRVSGMVRSVSADRITEQATGQSYYLARVEVSQHDLAALDTDIVMMPGMPAEVLVVTGKRTLLAYLMEPILAAFRRGLREV